MSKIKRLSVIWLEGWEMEIKKYLEKLRDNPPMFKKHFLIVIAVIFAMSIIFSRVKREKLVQDYKIVSEAVKIITQESLRSPYLKAPEAEKIKRGE